MVEDKLRGGMRIVVHENRERGRERRECSAEQSRNRSRNARFVRGRAAFISSACATGGRKVAQLRVRALPSALLSVSFTHAFAKECWPAAARRISCFTPRMLARVT